MSASGPRCARRCSPATGNTLALCAPSSEQAERAWDEALEQAAAEAAQAPAEPGQAPAEIPAREQGSLLPLREQVHQALSLLTVPASPRLIATVHEAFFASTFPNARLTSLRRDEERSFRTAPFARPYYICAALTADLLAPARGLLAISTWPMERRVIGSLSPRVDFLSAAIQVAEAIERLPAPVPAARRLLWRFAASIPGAAENAARDGTARGDASGRERSWTSTRPPTRARAVPPRHGRAPSLTTRSSCSAAAWPPARIEGGES